MKYSVLAFAVAGLLAATQVWAVPTLQVGAPGGAGEGTYANYTGSSTSPVEDNTAIIQGSTILVGGTFGSNTIALGGYTGTNGDWGSVGLTNFAGVNGAILVVSVKEGEGPSAGLTVNGQNAFYRDAVNSYFPNDHAPVKSDISDFLFFNIGNFTESIKMPDFADETIGNQKGLIKSLTLAGFGSLSWAHFDVMALITNERGTNLVTSLDNNPGSHDVTWKKSSSCTLDCGPREVPEPASLLLMSAGLIGFGFARRRRSV